MLIDIDARKQEREPPAGGIFLPENEHETLMELLGTYEQTVAESRRAQDTLQTIFPLDQPELIFQASELCLKFIHRVMSEHKMRAEAVIGLRVSDKMERRRIKHALYADTREVLPADRKKYREWLGTIDEQNAVLWNAGVAIDYEPPSPLLEFGIGYREMIQEKANREANATSVVRKKAEGYIQRLLTEWPDLAGNIGEHFYTVAAFPYDKTPYLVYTEDEITVHFMDGGFDSYDNKRHAGTIDYLIFLQDYMEHAIIVQA